MALRLTPAEVARAIVRYYSWAADEVTQRPGYPGPITDQAPAHSAILAMVDAIPSELLPRDPDDVLLFVKAVGTMREAVAMWRQNQHWMLSGRHDFGTTGTMRHAAGALADVLRRCPDQVPAEGTTALPFIADVPMRDAIRQDMSSATHALGVGEFKASAVLAGSALEALLLWAVEQHDGAARAAAADAWQAVARGGAPPQFDGRTRTLEDPADWQLSTLTEMAFHLGAIDDATRDAARLARDARNIVHPGKVRRGDGFVSKATALVALAAMERVAERLAVRFPGAPPPS